MNIKNTETIYQDIIEIFNKLEIDSESPWVSLANLGNALRALGISPMDYGYNKLKPFLESFDNFDFENSEEDSSKPAVYLVRIRSKKGAINASVAKPQRTKAPNKNFNALTKLSETAYIDYPNILRLVNIAREENWGEIKEDSYMYSRIYNYLKYTFKRLVYEKKIVFSKDIYNNDYFAFNTGLVSKSYEWIYALFKVNIKYEYGFDWYLVDFVTAGEKAGKTLNAIFENLPERANYFGDDIGNILFDTKKRICCDYEHIIIDNADRLPPSFFSSGFPVLNGISIEDAYGKPKFDKSHEEYYTALRSALRESPDLYNQLKIRFEKALEMTKKRVEWNYKTAVPMYYPTSNKASLLLPIALTNPNKVDVALVVTKEPSGAYQGQTVLTMDLAYINSRLITKPDSDWLCPDDATPFQS